MASKGIIKLRYDKNSITEENSNLFKEQLQETFGADIIAYENIDISKILFELLKENNLTLSLIESVTGGEFSSRITKYPGASSVLKGSSVVYTKEAKKMFLNEIPVSSNWEVLAENLSTQGLNTYFTDINLSILGEAGPISSSKYGIGDIFINISDKNNSLSSSHKIKGNREEIIQRSVNKAIWELINFIKNLY